MKNVDFIALFKDVHENDKPLFGNMTPAQVVNHLTLSLRLSIGDIQVPRINSAEREEKVKRVILGNDRPFPKGLQLPGLEVASAQIGIFPLHEAIESLNFWRDKFYHYYSENPSAKNPHPAMGLLNFKEWDLFHNKHFTHHLSQYALSL